MGGPTFLQIAAPSVAEDRRFIQWFGRFQRSAVGPAAATAWLRSLAESDIRDVLEKVAPVGAQRDPIVNGPPNIPGAKYVELPGADYLLWVRDIDLLLDEVQEFLTGVRAELEPERVVRTVLFTDIVGSTEHATRLGDRRWRDLLEAHHDIVRRNLERFGGVEVDTAGDGFFAVFDGPARAIRCAGAVRDEVRGIGIEIRAGIHAGEVEIRGARWWDWRCTSARGSRATADAGEVVVSSTVRDLVAGSQFEFEARGEQALKGVPGTWRLFTVVT